VQLLLGDHGHVFARAAGDPGAAAGPVTLVGDEARDRALAAHPGRSPLTPSRRLSRRGASGATVGQTGIRRVFFPFELALSGPDL